MGDGVEPPPQYYKGQDNSKRTFIQFLDEIVAYYMSIGMTRDQVLYGDRGAFDDYELAHEYDIVQRNQAWHAEGYYNYIALSCALSSAFAAKGKKGTPYPQYPTPMTETEREAEKKRNIERTLAFVRGRKRDAHRS